MNICVLIPAYNEVKMIGKIVAAIKMKKLDVLVIDDGSKDGTGNIAAENGAEVIRNDRRQGKGFSLQKGFIRALEKGCHGVITMDGDGQHAVDDLDVFIPKIREFPDDVITGNRMQNPRGMPGVRLATNRFMSWLISLICRQTIPDTQCGYRYIGKDVLKGLQLTTTDFEIETEVLVQASRLGRKIISVPVQTIYQDEKSKINPWRDTIRFLFYIVKVMRTEKSFHGRKASDAGK